MPAFIDLTGQRFGRWIVIRRDADKAYRHPTWLCRCDCGNTGVVTGQNLRVGKSQSCGCRNLDIRRDICLARNTTHGRSKSITYDTWVNMRQRCQNPRATAFHKYGAKGVRVCARWQAFEAFLADMGERPSAAHSIDRIDNDLGYQPGNCRWATQTEQQNNRRNSRNRLKAP